MKVGVLSIIGISLLVTPTALAATGQAPDYDFYSSNDVLFYDPTASSACNDTGVSIVVTSGAALENLKQAYAYFIAKGLSNQQSAGIVGNMFVESGGYTNRLQGADPGKGPANPQNVSSGWGLVQWTPGSKVIGIQKNSGVSGSIVDLQTQLDVLWWEISVGDENAVLPAMKAASDVASATAAFQNSFERPADRTGSLGERTAFANTAFKTFPTTVSGTAPVAGGATPTTPASAPTSSCGSSTPGIVQGNIVQTAQGFALPQPVQNTSGGWKAEAKPSFVSAVEQYDSAVLSLGEPAFADCGIFVSTVMRASGVDKDYPPSGTQVQQDYLKSHPDKYQILENPQMAQLQPGDILLVNNASDHHTLIYTGEIGKDAKTGETLVATDASQQQRPPSYRSTASVQSILSKPGVFAARFKGGTSV